jgi:hypothetical protein
MKPTLFFLLLVFFLSEAKAQTPVLTEYYEKGHALYAAHRWSEALVYFKKYTNYAADHNLSNRYPEALAMIHLAIDSCSKKTVTSRSITIEASEAEIDEALNADASNEEIYIGNVLFPDEPPSN